ncbi:MAG: hypothetical protein M0R49_13185 [Limnochordia bacterium]|nr:hypothetical protein [Limnochordia bacterium]
MGIKNIRANKFPLLIFGLFLCVMLITTGLSGCSGGKEKPDTGNENIVIDLIEQSSPFFFRGTPQELYLGEATQESFLDQGVEIKYLGSFNDGEAFYLFLDVIDIDGDFFGDIFTGRNFSINEYDFFEKTGYTDSKIYEVISWDKDEGRATLCIEYIGLLEETSISFHIYSMSVNATPNSNNITGDWEIKFAINNSLTKKLEADKTVPFKGHEFLVRRAVISPINTTLFASREDVPKEINRMNRDDIEIKIVYEDGDKTIIPKESGYIHKNQKGYMFRIPYTAENFENIEGLEINGVLFPVVEKE